MSYSQPPPLQPGSQTCQTTPGLSVITGNYFLARQSGQKMNLLRFAMAACGTDEPNGVCNDCTVNPAAEICREYDSF